MNAPLYTTEILRLAASLEEPKSLERVDGRAEQRSPTCGSRIVTEVQLDSEGRVAALSQQVQACAFGQAAAALAQRYAAGRNGAELESALAGLTAWLAGRSKDAPDLIRAHALRPALTRTSRHPAILLPFQTLAEAVRNAGR